MELWKHQKLLETLGNAPVPCVRAWQQIWLTLGILEITWNIPTLGKTPKDQSPTGVIRMEIQETSKDSSHSCHLRGKMGKSFEGLSLSPRSGGSSCSCCPRGPSSAPATRPGLGVPGQGGVLGVCPPSLGVLKVRSGPWCCGHLVMDGLESTWPRRKSSGRAAKPRRPWGDEGNS